MGCDNPRNSSRVESSVVRTPSVSSLLRLPEKSGCRIRKDRSWMWLVGALLVLLGGMALLLAMLLWLPGLLQ